jgi:hypothetical protein
LAEEQSEETDPGDVVEHWVREMDKWVRQVDQGMGVFAGEADQASEPAPAPEGG